MSNEKGIDAICEILASPEYKQITGSYAKFDSNNNITGKCALGEIACRVGLKIQKPVDMNGIGVNIIMNSAGIDGDLVVCLLPNFYEDFGFNFDIQKSNIGLYIMILNDMGYTYPQIIEFLQTTFP